MDGHTDRQIDRQTDERTAGQTDKRMGGQTDTGCGKIRDLVLKGSHNGCGGDGKMCVVSL